MSVWSPALDSNVDSQVVAYWNLFTNTQVQHVNQHSVNHRIYHHWHRNKGIDWAKIVYQKSDINLGFKTFSDPAGRIWFWKVLIGRNVWQKIPSFDHSWGGKGMYPSWKKQSQNTLRISLSSVKINKTKETRLLTKSGRILITILPKTI